MNSGAARTLTSRKQPGQGPTRRNRTYWMTLRLVNRRIWDLASCRGPVVEGDALDAGEGVTGLAAGQDAAGALGVSMTTVTWTPRVTAFAQCLGQRRVGAPGRLHGEGRDAGDNGPIAVE